ncbi:MAG: hypothetical protein P4L46_18115 [Fimbriimonas sp.]|nr:hypothetical protein [Fimbriimonas sp.]
MTFGWQGFTLDHPDDWAPVTLTGSRSEGYVRVASPTRFSLQIRWQSSKSAPDLNSVLQTYFDRLRRDAKSAKRPFTGDSDEKAGFVQYRYTSGQFGRGVLLYSPSCSRTFFLEAISTKNDSLLSISKKLLDSFKSTGVVEWERWALFGLDINLPYGLEVEKKVLQSGHTKVTFANKSARIEADRWGFAEQLIAKHGLEPWARSVMRFEDAEAEVTSDSVLFRSSGSLIRKPTIALARVQLDRNQITTLAVYSRSVKWKPDRDWFN